ncbi:MAG: GTP-binding protein, partial [Bacteroidota bacterium]
MKTYSTEAIRNIALVGHQGSGKTMLAEAMMFNAGAINRMGQIEAGSTVSDYHPSEKERQMSIFSTLLSLEWNGRKLNVLDTPGYPDFAGDVVSALRAADSAVFVINAGDGVQLGTDLAWRYTTAAHAPSMFLVNQLDRSDVESFDEVVTQLQTRFGRGVTVVQIPGGSGTRSIIDVLIMKQIRFPEGEKPVVGEIDAAFKERAEQLHNELVENIAENDEDLMELYFEQGELTEEQMRKGLHAS